jgi:hypothetical protein
MPRAKASHCLCRISLGEPCEIMPRAKASHCLRRISQGEPRAPLPLRHSECVAAGVSRLKLLPRRNNERTDVRCHVGICYRSVPKRQRAGALQDASRSPGRSEHPPGFGLRQPSAAFAPAVHPKMNTGKEFPSACIRFPSSPSIVRRAGVLAGARLVPSRSASAHTGRPAILHVNHPPSSASWDNSRSPQSSIPN